ncbi:triose-phosphate isomerase [Desulfopila aestuarii]|uniref:Triosephosphate isomerase n=1 Tax=Desulfopila aestuarii DSM 18488 TaxID=1121416 RepID=A0A1M7Y325_9BACT|nr:triose-phosphate isomerase family protein [Desulfopila aestuarii]SHO46235.1 triosephosphate isomerase [Desulfopila aestuarii DSM 18488]
MGLLSRFLQTEKTKDLQPPAGGVGRRLVVGNWKCYKTSGEAKVWFDTFAEKYVPSPDVEIVIAPTLLSLELVARYLEELNLDQVSLAAQDVSPFPVGGYTGAVAADMLKGLVDYVIVGHSERRRYFHETQMDVTNKITEVLDAGLKPIICVDRPYLVSQLSALSDLETGHALVAYCPVDALSFRIPESAGKVGEAVDEIRNVFPHRAIIYGGSILPDNAGEYLALDSLAGVFVGSASLEPESFLDICRQAAQFARPQS